MLYWSTQVSPHLAAYFYQKTEYTKFCVFGFNMQFTEATLELSVTCPNEKTAYAPKLRYLVIKMRFKGACIRTAASAPPNCN